MEAYMAVSATTPVQQTLTFDAAKEKIAALHKKMCIPKALKIIGYLGFVLSTAIAPLVIGFIALPLSSPYAAIPVALLILGVAGTIFGKRIYKKFVATTDLTPSKRVQIAVAHFMERIQNISSFTPEETDKLYDDIHSVSSPLLYIRFNPYKGEEPAFHFKDKSIEHDQLLKLLNTSMNHGVAIHLSTLEKLHIQRQGEDSLKTKKVLEESAEKMIAKNAIDQRGNEQIARSLKLSATFLKSCIESGTPLNVDMINGQLNMLAAKYKTFKNIATSLKPSIFLEDDKTIVIRSILGECGSALEAIQQLDIAGYTIKLLGRGHRISAGVGLEIASTSADGGPKWQAFMTQLQSSKCTIIDQTDKDIPDTDRWQEHAPVCTFPVKNSDVISYHRS